MPYLTTYFNPWLVAAMSSFCAGLSCSYILCQHLFAQDIRDTFSVTYQQASLVPSLSLALLYMGLFANILFNQFGYRKTLVGGGLLMAFSQFATSFTTSYSACVILLGFVNGIGCAICYTGSLMVAEYLFDHQHRHRAIALMQSGVGVGLMLFPVIFKELSHHYSFRQTLMLLSGLTLNIVVAAATFPGHLLYSLKDKRKQISDSEIGDPQEREDGVVPVRTKLIRIFRPQLLLDWRMMVMNAAVFSIAIVLAAMTSFNDSILIEDFDLGIKKRTILVSLTGACSLAGRLSVNFIKPSSRFPRWWTWSVLACINGFSILALGLLPPTGFWGAIFAQITYGFTSGVVLTLHFVVLSDLFDPGDFAACYGFNALFMMTACLVGPVLTGWLGDLTDSFRVPFYIAGSAQAAAFFVPVTLRVPSMLKMSKDEN